MQSKISDIISNIMRHNSTKQPLEQVGLLCKLLHLMRRSASIAYGRLMGESLDDPGHNRFVSNNIVDKNVDLVNREGKFNISR